MKSKKECDPLKHDWEKKLEIDPKGLCKPISYTECRLCGKKERLA